MKRCKAYINGRKAVSKEILPLISEMLRHYNDHYEADDEVYKTLRILRYNLELEIKGAQ